MVLKRKPISFNEQTQGSRKGPNAEPAKNIFKASQQDQLEEIELDEEEWLRQQLEQADTEFPNEFFQQSQMNVMSKEKWNAHTEGQNQQLVSKLIMKKSEKRKLTVQEARREET